MARGGGSFEDLLPFSDERLVRALAACPVPTVSAVGHEQDTPLSDLVADARASTPTAAGRLVVPDAELTARLDRSRGALSRGARTALERERRRIDGARDHLRRAPMRCSSVVGRRSSTRPEGSGPSRPEPPSSGGARSSARETRSSARVPNSPVGSKVDELGSGSFGARVEDTHEPALDSRSRVPRAPLRVRGRGHELFAIGPGEHRTQRRQAAAEAGSAGREPSPARDACERADLRGGQRELESIVQRLESGEAASTRRSPSGSAARSSTAFARRSSTPRTAASRSWPGASKRSSLVTPRQPE